VRPEPASLSPVRRAPGLALSPAQALRRACAEAFGISEAELIGPSRERRLSIARQAACYVLRRRFARLSYPVIGRMMGGRDHGSIIHAVRQTEARIARNAELAATIERLLGLPLGSAAAGEREPASSSAAVGEQEPAS
jgi:chromosomal replication initiation ATPase DnaA